MSYDAAVISRQDSQERTLSHERTLGVCWIFYGILRLALGLIMFLYSGTATVMFGQLLQQVPDPFTIMGVFHFLYAVSIGLSALVGVLGIITGLGLLSGSQSTRTLALLVAFLSLSNLPLGTTLGIYTLIELLPARPARQ